jgi:hypothetical protein
MPALHRRRRASSLASPRPLDGAVEFVIGCVKVIIGGLYLRQYGEALLDRRYQRSGIICSS